MTADFDAEAYISQANWFVQSGREELIDEIADEYERRRDSLEPRSGREAFWSRDVPGWPSRAAS